MNNYYEPVLAIVSLLSFLIMYQALLSRCMKIFSISASIFLFGGGYFAFIH